MGQVTSDRDDRVEVSLSDSQGTASIQRHPEEGLNVLSLPTDVIRYVLVERFLGDADAVVLRCTCRRLRSLVSHERLNKCRRGLGFYRHSVENGYSSRLEWLFTRQRIKIPTTRAPNEAPSFLCDLAARHGHLTVLQWLRQKKISWSVLTCSNAARGGHLAVLQWARANGCPWDQDPQYCASSDS